MENLDKNGTFVHPETLSEEIFFSNMNLVSFEKYFNPTKRAGTRTFDGNGNEFFSDDYFPVFISGSGVTPEDLTNLRREFRK